MLDIKNAAVTFKAGTPNEVRALRGVDLFVNRGEFVVVIGMNGSGKSTLQNAVSGTIKLDQGIVKLADHDITKWSEDKRARLIGRVFQNPFAGTAPGMSIAENIALAAKRGKARGLGWALSSDKMEEFSERLSLLRMGLESRMHTPIGSLSGGQRQAITLLMASWLKPELLLLDEHTAALDPKSADKIIQCTDDIVKESRLTTLMVTHSMQQAANLGDRIIMMYKGQIVHNISGEEKRKIQARDLLDMFEEIRLSEQLDESAAQMLAENYCV